MLLKLIAVPALVGALLSAGAGTASAITDGELDGARHPYVGLMVAQDADHNPLWRCSGTLMTPTLFMTAGHCAAAPAAHIEIWFAPDVQSGIPANGYPYRGDAAGAPYTHPAFGPPAFYLHDLGVVVLSKPYKDTRGQYGRLPSLNALDALQPSAATVFTAVGYGLQQAFPTAAEWKDQNDRVRMLARPQLVQINTGLTGDGSLILSNNTNTGGTCFGDSGGPNFIGNTNVVGGVTSFGLNGTCSGTGGVYRVDRADDLDWLATFGLRP